MEEYINYEKLEVFNRLKNMYKDDISNMLVIWYILEELHTDGKITEYELLNIHKLSSERLQEVIELIKIKLKERTNDEEESQKLR